MPDYSDLLDFLAKNPPQIESERQLHASLLELMAQCLRSEENANAAGRHGRDDSLDERIQESHTRWVHFN